jgi:hypothetical protein
LGSVMCVRGHCWQIRVQFLVPINLNCRRLRTVGAHKILVQNYSSLFLKKSIDHAIRSINHVDGQVYDFIVQN